MSHLHGVLSRNGSYKFQYLLPRRYLDWKAKAVIKSVLKQNVKYDWWDTHVVDNNGDKRPEWKKSITPGIK